MESQKKIIPVPSSILTHGQTDNAGILIVDNIILVKLYYYGVLRTRTLVEKWYFRISSETLFSLSDLRFHKVRVQVGSIKISDC
jgi:hypothetical protein